MGWRCMSQTRGCKSEDEDEYDRWRMKGESVVHKDDEPGGNGVGE
jgi:hypothetical protein